MKPDAENSVYVEAQQVRAQSESVSGLSFECPKLVDIGVWISILGDTDQ